MRLESVFKINKKHFEAKFQIGQQNLSFIKKIFKDTGEKVLHKVSNKN